MPKIMIASDLHGEIYYVTKLLDAFKNEGTERLLLLGDILYHGPRNGVPKNYDTKAVFTLLNGIKDKIKCIKGNCDAEVDEMVLEFPLVKDSILVFPSFTVFATHGHIINENNMPPLQKGDILLHGHTHVPTWITNENGIRIFNPGSVSIPKNGSRHSYMIMDEKCAIWKDVETREEYHREVLI